jgi:prepilin-type N-terminal cleavage/methylation domain-containing protein
VLRALVRRLAAEHGYSLTELVVVMAILGTIVTGITTLFVSGTKAELQLQSRYDVQSGAITSLARLRNDVHCANSALLSSPTADTVTLSTPCNGGIPIQWCAKGTTGRYRLYRRASAGTCATTDTPYADYLTTNLPWDVAVSTPDSLAKLKVNLSVKDAKTMTIPYTLCDTLVLRNSQRVDMGADTATAC